MTRAPNTSPTVSHGNCLDVLKDVDDNTYAAVVTDPPYGLTDIPAAKSVEALTEWVGGNRSFVPDGMGFMSARWDRFVPPPALWDEVFRTLKPGGHAFVFSGARTVDLMGMSLRLAGFEIRDTISWIRSDGMPKGQELSKAMTRKGVPVETAEQWKDFHSALKPAVEPIICAQKPLNLVYFNWHLVSEVHHALAGLLWLSLSNARRAEALSRSVNRGLSKECVSALVGAAMDTSLEKSEVMGMFSSRELDSTSWSIASSWSAILDALSDQTKMSTTSMRLSTTTVLKILNSLLAPITSVITTDPCECLLDGGPPNAMDAEKLSRDVHAKSTNMRNASVPESVIEAVAGATCSALASLAENLSIDLEVENSVPRNAITQGQGGNSQRSAVSSAAKTSSRAVGQDASVQLNAQSTVSTESSRPAVEPIIVARKPLDGTLIENAIEHGVGVLNIGACRVPANNRPLRETRPNGKDSKVFRNGKGSVAVGTTDNGRFRSTQPLNSCIVDTSVARGTLP